MGRLTPEQAEECARHIAIHGRALLALNADGTVRLVSPLEYMHGLKDETPA